MGRVGHALVLLGALAVARSTRTFAQKAIPPEDVKALSESPAPEDPLLTAVIASVFSIDSSGERNIDAIANYSVTLGIHTLQDDSALSVLCTNGGTPLIHFSQSLAEHIGLNGKASKPNCTVGGSDGSTLSFHLHRDIQNGSLFQENPLLLPVSLMQPDSETQPEETFEPSILPFNPQQADTTQQAQQSTEPILLNPIHTQTSHASITLAQGWTPYDLPAPIHLDSPFATFDLTMTFADKTLVVDQKLVIKKDKVEPSEREVFEKWFEQSLMEGITPFVRLKSASFYPNSAYNGKTEEEKKAIGLMEEAQSAINGKQYGEAQRLLDRAQAIDPNRELLHKRRADLAEAQGHYEEAVKEHREELRAFPEALEEMESLALTQYKMGRKDDALLTFQTWMAADLDSPFPAIDLMNFYREMHRDDLAASVGDQAMSTLHPDARQSVKLLSLYGRVLLRTGQLDKARSVLETVLDTSTDSDLVNDAVYYLSEKGLFLDRGEEALRDTLRQYDTDYEPAGPGLNSTALPAYWDSLGWVLFQKKEINDAEKFIRAAWHSRQQFTIGRHLGDVLVALEKDDEAADAYQLALATIPEKLQPDLATDPDVIAIHQAIDRLKKQNHVSTIQDPKAALERLRVIDTRPAGKLRGETLYTLNITTSGVDGFTRTGELLRHQIDPASIKLPTDFFPPDFHPMLTQQATMKCSTTTCTLTLAADSP